MVSAQASPLTAQQSAAPPRRCAIPLAVRVGAIDTPFGIGRDTLHQLLRQATDLWTQGTTRQLLQVHETDGIPVHLVYGERFARELARRAAAANLDARRARYAAQKLGYDTALAHVTRRVADAERASATYADSASAFQRVSDARAALVQAHNARNTAYAARLRDYEGERAGYAEAVATYNRTIAAVNARGGSTAQERPALDSTLRLLQTRKTQLDGIGAALRTAGDSLDQSLAIIRQHRIEYDSAYARLERLRQALNARADTTSAAGDTLKKLRLPLDAERQAIADAVTDYNARFAPPAETSTRDHLAGHFVIDSLGARIEIFTFADPRALVVILAHEMGHALGLDHASAADAVMYPVTAPGQTRITAADRALWDAACPTPLRGANSAVRSPIP